MAINSIKKMPWMKALFGAVVLMVLCLGSYHLTESPPTWYDEGMILQLADNLADHGHMILQLAPDDYVSAWHVSTGYPVVVPVALAYKLFGVGILQARSVAVMFMVILIVAVFLLLRKLYDPEYALWGASLVATFSSLYGNGKNVLGEVPGLFFLVVFLFFAKKLEDTRFSDWRYGFWASIFLGLTCASKPIFFLAIPAFVIALLINRQGISWNKSWIGAFIAGGVITGALWIYMQFGPTDSLSSILHFYANPYDASSLSSPIFSNIKRFFTEATPIYTLLTFLIWTVAVTIRSLKKIHISSVEICAYIFSTLILIAYLRMPGWYRYLFPANIPILMFLPNALKIISQSVCVWMIRQPIQRYKAYIPQACLACFLAFQGYYLFFGSWISTASSGTQSVDLTAYGATMNQDKTYFIYDAPQVVPFLNTDNYHQYFSGNGVWVAGSQYLDLLKKGQLDVVIIEYQNLESAASFLAMYTASTSVGRYRILERKALIK